ncbi:radical SAM protein [Catellatospora coxensis]|uniref:AmmeMemoRadiSam system radical SAM enzyme n=1 Tax=Catellatospora coxensis TaxID=310354 RepID=A0A8J3L9M5_9ACTN|nr:radical SAM protein [Catellatospora coxensis]GIG10585.1 AmmeMemoRadiSam system radical SAM enzyme [Catellatospora coxensis]
MQTATHSISVIHRDAVERKPFFHYRPGRSTITIAAPGCTFSCSYCVNYRLSQYGRPDSQEWTGEIADVEAVVADAATEQAIIALSYTEPALAIELTLALAEASDPYGVEIAWKSNGFLTDRAVDTVAPVLAAVNIDLKAADNGRHRRLTGAPLTPVWRAIRRLREFGVWIELSTPLIPGYTDDPEDLATLAAGIADIDIDIPWHLLRFTPTFRMTSQDPTSPDALAGAVSIARSAGLRYVYVERALGDEGRATRCPGCGTTVVTRGIWNLTANVLVDGRCPACDNTIAGRW